MKKFVLLLFIFSFLLPVLLGATDLNFDGLVTNTIRTLYNPIIKVIFALAFIVFFWGMVTLIIEKEDIKRKEKAKQKMMWGIIVLFIMFSIWGIISILQTSFDLNKTPLNQPINTYPDFYPVSGGG